MTPAFRLCAEGDDRYHDPARTASSVRYYDQAVRLGNKLASLNLQLGNVSSLYATATPLLTNSNSTLTSSSSVLTPGDNYRASALRSKWKVIAVVNGGLARFAKAKLSEVEEVAEVEILFDVDPLGNERAVGEFYGALVLSIFAQNELKALKTVSEHTCVVIAMVSVAHARGRAVRIPDDLSGEEVAKSVREAAVLLKSLGPENTCEDQEIKSFRTLVVCYGGDKGRLDLERQMGDRVSEIVEERWDVSLEEPDVVFLALSSPLGFCCGFVLGETSSRWKQGRIPVETRKWFTQVTTRARMRPSRARILIEALLAKEAFRTCQRCPPHSDSGEGSTAKVLDFCAGLGTIPLEVAQALVEGGLTERQQIEIISLDIDPQARAMVEQCWIDFKASLQEKSLPTLRALTGNCYAMPILDSSIDLAFSDLPYGRQHSNKLDFCYLLMELARVLKIGAKMLLLVSIEQAPKLIRASRRYPPAKEPIWSLVDLRTTSERSTCDHESLWGCIGMNAGGIDCVAVCLQLEHKNWKWRKSRWWTVSRKQF